MLQTQGTKPTETIMETRTPKSILLLVWMRDNFQLPTRVDRYIGLPPYNQSLNRVNRPQVKYLFKARGTKRTELITDSHT